MATGRSSTLARIWQYLKDRKKQIGFLLILIIISQGASILVPFVSKDLIDALTRFIKAGGALPLHTLLYCALGILVASLVSSVFESLYNYHLFLLVTKVEDRIRSMAFEKYLGLHSLFHHGASSGQIIGR